LTCTKPQALYTHKEITMNLTRRKCFALAAGLLAAASAGHALARTSVIKVSLWDKGAMSMNMLGQGPMMGMGMGTPGTRMPMGPMGITVSTRTVKAGEVTFEVSNASRTMVHEMVIASIKDANTPLPYIEADNKVDEDAAGRLGEVAELDPGKKGALTLTLKPGQYVLYCNIPGHYILGMWTLVTVK
jgi:uncharacterized cupredoxin-like copper-binding protein